MIIANEVRAQMALDGLVLLMLYVHRTPNGWPLEECNDGQIGHDIFFECEGDQSIEHNESPKLEFKVRVLEISVLKLKKFWSLHREYEYVGWKEMLCCNNRKPLSREQVDVDASQVQEGKVDHKVWVGIEWGAVRLGNTVRDR